MRVYRSVSGTPTALPMFKWALLGPFTIIIRREIERESIIPLAVLTLC